MSVSEAYLIVVSFYRVQFCHLFHCNFLFSLWIVSFPFRASVARFMDFSATLVRCLEKAGNEEEEKDTANWEVAGSRFPLFLTSCNEAKRRVPRKPTSFEFPRFRKDAEVNKV